jgi:uncharacterized protein (DUF1778 family)
MGTTKPRITITLDEELHAVLRSISAISGKPMSSFVSELLSEVRPMLDRMAKTFAAIKQVEASERTRFVGALDDAQAAAEPAVREAAAQFILFMDKVDQVAASARDKASGKGGSRSSGRGPSPKPTAPPTNRGVTPRPAKSSKPSSAKALKPVLKKKVFLKVATKKPRATA